MKSCVIFLTGIPCSGKSTIAMELCKLLMDERIYNLKLVDGDNFRQAYSRDLGFSKEDRYENLMRAKKLMKEYEDKGYLVIAGFIAPYREVRQEIRDEMNNFIEVHVHCDPGTCMERDVKGMWEKAISGEIKNFTGYSDPYEIPINPEIICFTADEIVTESALRIFNYLKEQKII